MTTEVIEGEAREVALTVIEPREMLAETATPEGTVALATRMATALKDIVDKQKLYTVINGKKYPQVEAWMTIARMDNVVAREVIGGIVRHDDGSYEAMVELIRLSDGMIIGRGSALCGSVGDEPWKSKRPEPARRSMAVTRATSRAFRQQYSWIMALAGYEPTPADEMPQPDEQRPVGTYSGPPDRPQLERTTHESGLVGIAELGKAKGKDKDGNPKGPPGDTQFELREEATRGWVIGFRLTQGRKGYKVLAFGPLAEVLASENIIGERVTCWGTMHDESFVNDDEKTITYQVMHLERIETPDVVLPARSEVETIPLFDENDPARQADFEAAWAEAERAGAIGITTP